MDAESILRCAEKAGMTPDAGERLAAQVQQHVEGKPLMELSTDLAGSPEIQAAVEWWAKQLESPAKMDNGDPFQSAFATMAQSKMPRPTEKDIAHFRREFPTLLAKHCASGWRVDDPGFGSYQRCVSVDYGPEPTLLEALPADAVKRGANSFWFPIKTHMWINPGEVKVSCGYRAEPEVLYRAGSPAVSAEVDSATQPEPKENP